VIVMPRIHALSAIALAVAAVSTPLSAQPGERDDPHLRNDCRLAAQVIQTGNPAARRGWALDTIRRCDDSGPQVLADVWRTDPPAEPQALAELFNSTRDFNDRRIVDAVADVARRSGAPETTRIYALTLLYSYAVPGLYIEADDLINGARPAISSVTHDARVKETRELLGDLRPAVGELLAGIVAREPRSSVGTAAAAVLRYLRAS
jgi:hypothetical protein